MLEDLMMFSNRQLITVTAASNYAGTGAGSAGAGVLDCGLLTPSPGGQAGFGQDGVFGGSPQRFMLTVSVAQVFAGPVGSTLLTGLQDSADNTTFNTTNLSMIIAANFTLLQIPGQILLQGDLPAMGGSTLAAISALRQYLRMLYTVGGGPFTAGAISAWIDVM